MNVYVLKETHTYPEYGYGGYTGNESKSFEVIDVFYSMEDIVIPENKEGDYDYEIEEFIVKPDSTHPLYYMIDQEIINEDVSPSFEANVSLRCLKNQFWGLVAKTIDDIKSKDADRDIIREVSEKIDVPIEDILQYVDRDNFDSIDLGYKILYALGINIELQDK